MDRAPGLNGEAECSLEPLSLLEPLARGVL
jgi:hypothetical protein